MSFVQEDPSEQRSPLVHFVDIDKRARDRRSDSESPRSTHVYRAWHDSHLQDIRDRTAAGEARDSGANHREAAT